jgi:flagellar FliJ protein
MKKFKFQLETLLKVTRMKKEDAEVKFAEVSRRLEEQKEQLQLLINEMEQGQRDYETISQEGTRVTIGRITSYNRFFAWKREQIEIQRDIILHTREERQRKLKALMEVMTYLKSIEQLKEKRLREYNEQVMFEEQKFLDELGLQLTMRARREAAS